MTAVAIVSVAVITFMTAVAIVSVAIAAGHAHFDDYALYLREIVDHVHRDLEIFLSKRNRREHGKTGENHACYQ